MLGLGLVRALEDDWRDVLDAVARRHRFPTSRDVARLGASMARLSAAYNDASVARAAMTAGPEKRRGGDAWADTAPARLGFAFARDVPKGAGAVRELIATGLLRMPEPEPGPPSAPVLRVLDVGAGLGATTWGLVRSLEAAGARGVVEAAWYDPDTRALALGADIARERAALEGGANPAARVTLRVIASGPQPPAGGDSRTGGGSPPFDVVLLGQVLSELDVALSADERLARHADLLGSLLEHRVRGGGSLVVIEPALRDRSRHLHRVRDVLAARGATVFAPCTHGGPCPALAVESDWCHEDLPIDLPPWLVPVARAAGLRHQGLTYSYLVLRKDGARVVDALAPSAPFPAAARLRVVSGPLRSKGKREAFVCGTLPGGDPGIAPAPARVRAVRLDRDETAKNAVWEKLSRGDVVLVAPAPTVERPRIGPSATVTRLGDTESH
jgi:Mitochondrial small ribosomal subunit Rsm22